MPTNVGGGRGLAMLGSCSYSSIEADSYRLTNNSISESRGSLRYAIDYVEGGQYSDSRHAARARGAIPMSTMSRPQPAVLASTPAQYQQFGLQKGQVAPWEDGIRTDGGPGSFEWWYF